MIKRIKYYLHSDKESNRDVWDKISPGNDKGYEKFRYAMYEVEFELDVNLEDGTYTIYSVNGKVLPK